MLALCQDHFCSVDSSSYLWQVPGKLAGMPAHQRVLPIPIWSQLRMVKSSCHECRTEKSRSGRIWRPPNVLSKGSRSCLSTWCEECCSAWSAHMRNIDCVEGSSCESLASSTHSRCSGLSLTSRKPQYWEAEGSRWDLFHRAGSLPKRILRCPRILNFGQEASSLHYPTRNSSSSWIWGHHIFSLRHF